MLTRMFIINSRTSSIWDKKDIKIECFFDSMEYNDISRNITKDFYNHIIYPKICKLYNEYINDENTDMLKIFKIGNPYAIVHYTGDEANTTYFSNPGTKSSAHYFIDNDSVIESVPDEYVAWSVGGGLKVYENVYKNFIISRKYYSKFN